MDKISDITIPPITLKITPSKTFMGYTLTIIAPHNKIHFDIPQNQIIIQKLTISHIILYNPKSKFI